MYYGLSYYTKKQVLEKVHQKSYSPTEQEESQTEQDKHLDKAEQNQTKTGQGTSDRTGQG